MLNNDALAQLRQLKQQIDDATERAEATIKGTQGRFGFAVVGDGREIFLPPEQMQRVFPGDRVRIIIRQPATGKPHGELEELLHSPLQFVTGRYQVRGQGHFVAPDPPQPQRWIFLPPRDRGGASPGDYVHCRVVGHPFRDGRARARVELVLGADGRPGLEVDYALAHFGITPPAPGELPTPPDLSGHRDLSDLPFVTIDSADTRDMDDALAAASDGAGWRLWVAVADASAWVPDGSAMDAHARALGGSLYLPGRNVGMLPADLAEERCALAPNETRPAMVCELAVGAEGDIDSLDLYPALVRPRARLTYTAASTALASGDPGDLGPLAAVAAALHRHRGAHQPPIPERPDYRLVLGDDGQIREIHREDKTAAHRLVEECMLAANRSVADWCAPRGGVFIAHDGFRRERLGDVRTLCQRELPGLEADPSTLAGYRALMHTLADYRGDYPLRAILSRWLQRARISTQASPHFGLGLEQYTTFTSPIRKFTDLMLHRIVRAHLTGRAPALPTAAELQDLQARAEQARRASQFAGQWLICRYAATLPREQPLRGSVCRIHSSGFGVRLEDSGIEGQVETRQLSGKYRFDPLLLELQGPDRRVQLEQAVTVALESVDTQQRAIRFRLLD